MKEVFVKNENQKQATNQIMGAFAETCVIRCL